MFDNIIKVGVTPLSDQCINSWPPLWSLLHQMHTLKQCAKVAGITGDR